MNSCQVKPEHINIVILGGGFAGVYTALELERLTRRRRDVSITLISRDNFLLFTPMLHEIAASDLDITHIVTPLRKLLKRTAVKIGVVESVDLDRRTIRISHGSDEHTHELPYDRLVIALGSVTNLRLTPGVAEHAVTMKTLGDAMSLRNRVIAFMEEADAECAASQRRSLMSFVVVGGGFAGVETIGALADFVHEVLRFYPNIRPGDVRMTLVHAGPVVLPELGRELGRYAQDKLQRGRVGLRLNQTVASVDAEGVLLGDGMRIDARTVIWTVGNAPNPLIAGLDCEKLAGRLKVNEYLEVPGRAGVYALGDCAMIPDTLAGGFHPPTAQHALREARTAARNLWADVTGAAPKPFRFKMIGQLAAIGRRSGVAHVFGLRFSGFPAWVMWRTIYLSKLPGLEKKVRVAIDWTLDLFFSKDLVQYQTTGEHMTEDPADTLTTGVEPGR